MIRHEAEINAAFQEIAHVAPVLVAQLHLVGKGIQRPEDDRNTAFLQRSIDPPVVHAAGMLDGDLDAVLLLQAQEAGDVIDLVHVNAQGLPALQDVSDDLLFRGEGSVVSAFPALAGLVQLCLHRASLARRRESAPIRVWGLVPFQSRVDMGL